MGYVWQRWLAAELRAAGLTVVEVEGWRNRGRPASTGEFDPRGPHTVHHTGTLTSAARPMPTLRLLVEGRPDLPGPLSQVGVAHDGTVYVIAAGRANHAGRVSRAHVTGMAPGADGNALSIGDEVDTNGTQAMPQAQRDAVELVAAVIVNHFDRDEEWVHRHQDISGTGKWDLGGVTTADLRAGVAGQLERLRGPVVPDNHVTRGRTAIRAGVRQIATGLRELDQVASRRVAVVAMRATIRLALRGIRVALKVGPAS